MKNEKISFVFFGSGPVAARSLELLCKSFTIEAVITKPTTVHEMRSACPDAPLYTVTSKRELDELLTKNEFTSTLGVLIDFGIIVSTYAINSFEKGIINSHFSLLPQLRGADPITYAILEGHAKTGVSMMLLVEAMDEGPLLAVGEYEMVGNETTPILTDKLIALSASILEASIPDYMNGDVDPAPQTDVAQSMGYSSQATYSKKLTKENGKIDWHKSAEVLEREIRAYSGWPKSYTKLGDIECVITKARVENAKTYGLNAIEAGSIHISPDKKLLIGTGHELLSIERLKPAGKKEMSAEAFLAGYRTKLEL